MGEKETKQQAEDKSRTFVKDDQKNLLEINEENLKLKEVIKN